jgi:hypothetical protein
MAMSPPLEKRYLVSDGISRPVTVRKSSGLDRLRAPEGLYSGVSAYGTGATARLLCQQRPARDCRPCLGELESK